MLLALKVAANVIAEGRDFVPRRWRPEAAAGSVEHADRKGNGPTPAHYVGAWRPMPSRQLHHRAWQRTQSRVHNDDNVDSGAAWRHQPESTEAEATGGGRVVKDFNLARAQLLARVAAPDVAANVLKLAYVITYKRMNVDSKMTTVGHETLAADLKVTVRTVQSLLTTLEPFGLVIERGGGRNKLSVYRIGSIASEAESANVVSPYDAERTKRIASFAETAKPDSLFPELTTPRASKQMPGDGFAAFWQAYPRRVAAMVTARPAVVDSHKKHLLASASDSQALVGRRRSDCRGRHRNHLDHLACAPVFSRVGENRGQLQCTSKLVKHYR